LLAVAAAVVVVIGGGAVINQWISGDGTGSSGASCAAVLTFRGQQYEPVETMRVPQPGKDLGTATTCSDTVANGTPSPADRVPVVAASGISPQWAFLYDGQLWVADRQDEQPAAIRRLQQPIRCVSTVGKLTGTVVQLDGRAPDDSPPTAAPYTITLRVTGHSLVPLRAKRYQAVLVRVHVTGKTRGANLVERLAQEPEHRGSVTVHLSCSGKSFGADRIAVG
jgi:hypothetical protein